MTSTVSLLSSYVANIIDGNNYSISVTVENNTLTVTNSWSSTFKLPPDQEIVSIVNGVIKDKKNNVRIDCIKSGTGANKIINPGEKIIFVATIKKNLTASLFKIDNLKTSAIINTLIINTPINLEAPIINIQYDDHQFFITWTSVSQATGYLLEEYIDTQLINIYNLGTTSKIFDKDKFQKNSYKLYSYNGNIRSKSSNVINIIDISVPDDNFVNNFPFDSLPGNMSLNQCDVIMSLVSIAENSSIRWWDQYNYAENMKDGRGITISLCGFCTGTYDFIQVVEDIYQKNPNHVLCQYLTALRKNNGTDKIIGLETLENTVHNLGNDKIWRESVWIILIKLYWKPAMDVAQKYGCLYPITRGELYDLALNHGSDQMEKMISLIKSPSPIKNGDEKKWLGELLDIRENNITKIDLSTNNGQPDRTRMWRSILQSDNVQLSRPINNLVCYGDKFTIN